MKIIIGKTSGFCKGVEFTVNTANNLVNSNNKLYCLGQIVHNERVVKDLSNKGMIEIYSLDEVNDNSPVIIRAHGESKETYDIARKKHINIKDLTCGKIKVIRKKISDKSNDYFIIIIGKKNHPETKGLISYATSGVVVENEEDLDDAIDMFNSSLKNKIYVVSQTTFNSTKFDCLVNKLKEKVPNILVDKTICDATSKRQDETKNLAQKTDAMLIIGGAKSSNTKELENVAKDYSNKVFLIQDATSIKDIDLSNIDTLGIMAGASTPNIVVEEVLEEINRIYN